MRYVLNKFRNSELFNNRYQQLVNLLMRFLDDIFGIWSGSHSDFLLFFDHLNMFLCEYGLEFEKKNMQIGKRVDFLDVSVDISSGSLETDIYI